MAEEAPPKARLRYSREPDLDIEVEGETVRVASFTLMAASDVFAKLLESGMRESEEGRIRLEGKSKAEFLELLAHLDIRHGAALPKITEEKVRVLLRWADEYQIHGLTERCQTFMTDRLRAAEGETPTVIMFDTLQTALKFKLVELQEQCAHVMAAKIHKYCATALQFVGEPTIMKVVFPALFAAAGLKKPAKLKSEAPSLEDVLPLVLRAIEAMEAWINLQENHAFAVHARSMEQALLTFLPRGYPGLAACMNFREIAKEFGGRFNDELMKHTLAMLCQKGLVVQPRPDQYYALKNARA